MKGRGDGCLLVKRKGVHQYALLTRKGKKTEQGTRREAKNGDRCCCA